MGGERGMRERGRRGRREEQGGEGGSRWRDGGMEKKSKH